jgi:heme O synthase-like polyprenyltransferase
MLGWVAATGDFGIEAGTLLFFNFLAIPHFWAIGWFLYEDYEKVFLCCQQEKTRVPLCRLFCIRDGLL